MKKNNLIIYTNSKLDNLGLGDYLRLVSFLPNFNFKKIVWISNKEIFPLLKFCENINELIDLDSLKKKIVFEKADLIINLFEENSNYKNTFFIKKILNKDENIKKSTVDIFSKISKKFGIKKFDIFHNQKTQNRQ